MTLNGLKKTFAQAFPLIRDILIFSAAIVTIAFNYLSGAIRQDIRTNAREINSVDEQLNRHVDSTTLVFESIDRKLNEIANKVGTIDSRTSRIEGKLEK